MTKSTVAKTDSAGGLETCPEITRNALELAVRTAANLHGLPASCRVKACRRHRRCQSDRLSEAAPPCQGGWSREAEITVAGMLAFFLHLTREVVGDPSAEPSLR